MKKIIASLVVAAMVAWSSVSTFAVDVQTQLQINPGTLSISNAGNGAINFGSATVSFTDQDLTVNTANLTVTDLLSSNSGYYTTLQMSGDMTSTNGFSIASGNIFVQTENTANGVVAATGSSANAADTVFANVAESINTFSALNLVQTYIERAAANYAGKVGEFTKNLTFKVTVPGGTPVGAYEGTLVYTLYDLSL